MSRFIITADFRPDGHTRGSPEEDDSHNTISGYSNIYFCFTQCCLNKIAHSFTQLYRQDESEYR